VFLLFATVSSPLWGPLYLLSSGYQGLFPWGVKRPRREADHSPASSAEVKDAGTYTSTPPYVFMAWCLVKHRYNFTITLDKTYSKVHVGKHLSDALSVENGLKTRRCFIAVLFISAVEYTIRKIQEDQEELQLNGTHKLLTSAVMLVYLYKR
jgi:hypothetical protein